MAVKFIKDHAYKLAVLWALVIFILCATPGRFIPTVSWLELLSFDKWVHAGVFFILVSLFGISVTAHHQNQNLFYFYVLVSILYGGALELMQAKLFSERSADWYDMIANSFGCLVALAMRRKINALVFK